MSQNYNAVFWFKLGMTIASVQPYIPVLVYMTFTFIQNHRSVRKDTFVPIISQSFRSVWMECCILLRLDSLMNLMLILFALLVFKGENST